MPIIVDVKPDYAAAAALIVGLPTELRAARASLNLDVKTQAKLMKISSTTLAKLDAGLTVPSQGTILAALRWLAAQA